jgi:4-hydroxybenzoate polyprenyltransferase/phosphoserine phosphatase
MNHPLVVDLDGTILRSDTLHEAMLVYAKRGLRESLQLPFWLLKGKAYLKEQLATRVDLPFDILPYNNDVLKFLQQAKKQQRQIILATATHRIYAEQIAQHLGLFDRVIATEKGINLSSNFKRDRLIEEFGKKGFDYIGNSHADISVWRVADKTYLADPDTGVQNKIENTGNITHVFSKKTNALTTLFRALRPHQWLKNILIFIPLLAAHSVLNVALLFKALLAFILFSLAASSGYLINDLFDLESDRRHPRKHLRPLASGEMHLQTGIIAAIILFIIALIFAFALFPYNFSTTLAIYFTLTFSYSQYLKKIAVVDTIVLAALYTIRILAGAFACNILPTFWLLAFSVFLFLSLAMVKRYAELIDLPTKDDTAKIRGRGYYSNDLEIIANLGSSAGYISVLVLCLYIQEPRTMIMYKNHELIWFACPILLFWISRMWFLTHRGQMHDDPVLFAIKDTTSLITAAFFALIFILATITQP